MVLRIVCLLVVLQLGELVTAEYLWHDISGSGYSREFNCTDEFFFVYIDDPNFKIKPDSTPYKGLITLGWYDSEGYFRYWWLDPRRISNGSVANGVQTECDGADTVPYFRGTLFARWVADRQGIMEILFFAGSDAKMCGATLEASDVTGDGVNDVFKWTSPIITIRYNEKLRTENDYHLSVTCTYQTAATVTSNDLGAFDSAPELVTSRGSLFESLSMSVYQVISNPYGGSTLREVGNGDMISVGVRMFVSINLQRNNENDDVGIKHFQCWAEIPAANNDVKYWLIDNGCPANTAASNDISTETRVFVDDSPTVVQLRWYYNNFGVESAALYRLYCVVELCTPSTGACENTDCPEGFGADGTGRRKRQAEERYQLQKDIPVLRNRYSSMEDQRSSVEPNLQTNSEKEIDGASCQLSVETLVPMGLLSFVVLVLLCIIAAIAHKLKTKTNRVHQVKVLSGMQLVRRPAPQQSQYIAAPAPW